jgi:crotonobetaine/carnitine-CoA ligase
MVASIVQAMIARPSPETIEQYESMLGPYDSIRDYFEAALAEAAGDPFVVYSTDSGDESYTYAEADERCNAIANDLRDRGLEPGDRITLMAPTSPEFVFVVLAAQKIGVVPAMINPELEGPTLEHCLKLPDSELIVTTSALTETVVTQREDVSYESDPIVIGDSSGDDAPAADEFTALRSIIEAGDRSNPPDLELPPDHPAVMPFSSGTTGLPKGILNPQRLLMLFGEQFSMMGNMDEGSGYLNTLPLFHQGGLWSIYIAIACRGYVTLFDEFSIGEFWNRVDEYDCRGTSLVDEMGRWLYQQPERPDDPEHALEWALIIGGPKEHRKAFESRFDTTYLTAYGSTEVGVFAWSPPEENSKPLADGVAETFEVRIADELDPGETGEIHARPCLDNVMLREYVGSPAKTVEKLRNCWYHTGDMGRLDEDGYLYFEGRKEDFVRRKGENISHAEIEHVVDDLEGVLESAVIGIPDESVGEEIKLHVLPAGDEVDVETVVGYCEDTLPGFQQPRYIEVIESFPRTPTERVQKHELESRGKEGLTEHTWDRSRADWCPQPD